VNYVLALVAVLLLESRTALLVFLIESAAALIILGRAKFLVSVAPFVAMGALAVLGPILVPIVSQGFSSHGVSMYWLLSGREQGLWIPLLFEWWNDPDRFYFGAGLFGILSSDLLRSGVIFGVGSAHNAYIDFFLDNGIFLAVAVVALIGAWLVWAIRLGRRIHSQIYWVLLVGVIGFLFACFTGRRLWPDLESILIFPLLAAMINVVRLKLYGAPAPQP
jgi:hypothetical protein